jgi:hypothetical protein
MQFANFIRLTFITLAQLGTEPSKTNAASIVAEHLPMV